MLKTKSEFSKVEMNFFKLIQDCSKQSSLKGLKNIPMDQYNDHSMLSTKSELSKVVMNWSVFKLIQDC
jgi:hypothetical protein